MKSNSLTCALLAGLARAATLKHQIAQKGEFVINETVNDLAQLTTEQTNSGNYCHIAHERIKNAQNIFYGVQAGSAEYVDPTFPRQDMIRDDEHPSFNPSGDSLAVKEAEAMWVDSIDILYDDEYHSLFGTNGIQPDDIFQGEIGNCWFMHGASAVAEKASRLERVFLNNELSSNGIYGLQFYIMGVPTTVTVDDSLPLDDNGSSVFAGISKDGALWGPILEKGFAKLMGTYESIIAGNAKQSIEALTGAPSTIYEHGDYNASEIFDLVKAANAIDGMISASTPNGENGNQSKTEFLLAKSHTYTVLNAFEVQNQNGQTVKLYRIRNPWGSENYNGPFNDKDTANWDPSLQAAVGWIDEDDGTFFIDAATYHAEFEDTQIHVDTTDMKHSYFLVKNDDTTNAADGPYCGFNDCQSRLHRFTVKSEEDQTVYMSTHTWPFRSYPRDCIVSGTTGIGPATAKHYTHFTAKNTSKRYNRDRTWYSWTERLYHPGFEMSAGDEITVTMEMEWMEDASKDFSLVFWGTGSQPILIIPEFEETHQSTFPFTAPQATDQNAAQESGADLCADNPAEIAFKDWYSEYPTYSGSCGSQFNWMTMGNGDFFYLQRGGCGNQSIISSFSYPQSFWDDIWISEGTVLMETTGPVNGLITKKFNLMAGTSGDRVAFFVKARNNVQADSISPDTVACNSCNPADYDVIGASGNDASCDGSHTTTDGTNETEADNGTDNTDEGTDDGTNDEETNDNGTDDGTDDNGTDDGTDNGTDDNTGIDAFNLIHLNAHNEYRALHGVPPLEFDQTLADAAQSWSDHLAAVDSGLTHSTGNNHGENLAWWSSPNPDAVRQTLEESSWASDAWYNEINDPGYDFNNPGFSSGIGHFTQMVWKSTTKLGCGVKNSYLTCRYSPAGNVLGQFEENVLPLVGDQDNNDDEDNTDDNTDPDPQPTVPDDIQEQLDTYAANLGIPSSSCGYIEATPTTVGDGIFSGIRISCIAVQQTRAARVMYTDTAENWAQTVDHCDNFFIGETTSGDQVTRTYGAWGPATSPSVAFWRPSTLTPPTAHGLALYPTGETFPDDTAAPGCEADETEEEDHTEGNSAANAIAQQAEGYKTQAEAVNVDAALNTAQSHKNTIDARKVTAQDASDDAKSKRDQCEAKFQAAETEDDVDELQDLQDEAVILRDQAFQARDTAGTAYNTAVALQGQQFSSAIAQVEVKETSLSQLKEQCDAARTSSNGYTATDAQLAAKQRTEDACDIVDGLYSDAEDAKETANQMTNTVATTVQEIMGLSGDATTYANEANQFVSDIGDIITEKNEDAINANNQASLDLATQAEGFRDQCSDLADETSAALETANEHKSTINGHADASETSQQAAQEARNAVQTALQEAEQLGTDLEALQAKRDHAAEELGKLNTAKDSIDESYSMALEVHNGLFTTAIQLVETKRRETEQAANNAANAYSQAETYQANDVQQEAYARSKAASEAAAQIYSGAQEDKTSATALNQASTDLIQTTMSDRKTAIAELIQPANDDLAAIDDLITAAEEAANNDGEEEEGGDNGEEEEETGDNGEEEEETGDNGEEEEGNDNEEEESGDNSEEEGGDNGEEETCEDTEGDALDTYSEGCWAYTQNPRYCGTEYDDDDFVANEMCCACGGGSTGETSDDDEDEQGPEECIDDDTTPQACLDEWVESIEITPKTCYISTKTLKFKSGGQVQYAYILFYGGCSQYSVDVWFTKTDNQWNNLMISSGSNLISESTNGRTKYFNLETGGIDGVGFRVPGNMVTDFDYTGVAISYD